MNVIRIIDATINIFLTMQFVKLTCTGVLLGI